MDRAQKFRKRNKRVMVNFTNKQWEEINRDRKKGQSDSALVKSRIFSPEELKTNPSSL